MNFDFTKQQIQIQQSAKDFADRDLKSVASKLDKHEEFPLKELKKLGKLRFMGINIPHEYGGIQAGVVAYSLAITEISKACASTAVTMSVSSMVCEAILEFGTKEQIHKYVSAFCSGDFLCGAFALTEPGSGSDAGSLRTRAEPFGDHFILNGSKIFISHGAWSDVIITMARTGKEKGTKGISAFIVKKDTPGLIIDRAEQKMGLKASNTAALLFEECKIPKENMLGKEGEGFKIAMMALDGGRIGVASQALGIGYSAYNKANEYVKKMELESSISNSRLLSYKNLLNNCEQRLEMAKMLTLRSCWMKEQKNKVRFTKEASMAKLFATETANYVCDNSLKIIGFNDDESYKTVERNFRDAKVTTIYEGTSEIQRLVIARELCC